MKTATSSGSIPRRCRKLALALWLLLAAASYAAGEVEIFPSGDVLPANHLKFYLHFAEPMREGVFLEYCRLLDERGQPVLEPFRETELWSDDRRRLTLWLHPGRQKTGVNLNEEFGPVLEPGRKYTLIISGQWPTERGPVLGHDAIKSFRTTARVTQQLDASSWQISSPRAGTREPLEVRFLRPLDHALLQRCLHAARESVELKGTVATSEGERVWRFTPEVAWSPGSYQLLVESILEDLGGNSLARPFERDLEAPPPRVVPRVVEIPFTCGSIHDVVQPRAADGKR